MHKLDKTYLTAGILFIALSIAPGSRVQSAPLTTLLNAYTSLPMRFEENVGQTDHRVEFLSRGPGYTLFLTPGEAVFVLGPQSDAAQLKSKFVTSSNLR